MDHLYLTAVPRKISMCARHTQYSMLHPDRIMREHDFIYCTRGTWEIWQNEKSYTLHSGECLLLNAGEHHYGRQRSSADCETIFIHFSAESEDRLISDADSMPAPDIGHYVIPVLTQDFSDNSLYRLFGRIVDAFWSSNEYASIEAEAYLTLLLTEIARSHVGNQEKQAKKNELINKLLMMMDFNEDHMYSNEELAAIINVHPRTLHNYFIEIVGAPAHRYQIREHLNKAHKLLASDPSLPLSVVAERFGFCDEFNFSKHYKRQFGHSPKKHDWKKRI